MCVIGKNQLVSLIKAHKCIHPFDYGLLDGDGYVLTVKEERTLHYLEHQNLVSNEVVFTPPEFVAHLTAKSKYGRMGLSFLNAAKVHSGFIGRLALELVNLSNERQPITIKRGDPLMHIEFMKREGEASPYNVIHGQRRSGWNRSQLPEEISSRRRFSLGSLITAIEDS